VGECGGDPVEGFMGFAGVFSGPPGLESGSLAVAPPTRVTAGALVGGGGQRPPPPLSGLTD